VVAIFVHFFVHMYLYVRMKDVFMYAIGPFVLERHTDVSFLQNGIGEL